MTPTSFVAHELSRFPLTQEVPHKSVYPGRTIVQAKGKNLRALENGGSEQSSDLCTGQEELRESGPLSVDLIAFRSFSAVTRSMGGRRLGKLSNLPDLG